MRLPWWRWKLPIIMKTSSFEKISHCKNWINSVWCDLIWLLWLESEKRITYCTFVEWYFSCILTVCIDQPPTHSIYYIIILHPSYQYQCCYIRQYSLPCQHNQGNTLDIVAIITMHNTIILNTQYYYTNHTKLS